MPWPDRAWPYTKLQVSGWNYYNADLAGSPQLSTVTFLHFAGGTPPPSQLRDVTIGDTPEHFVTGDFNGDAWSDVASIYNNGNNTISIWVWPGTTSGPGAVYKAYSSCAGCWNWAGSTFVAGDFNGDFKTDLAGIYDYGGNTIGIWIWPGTATGLGSPYKAYTGCAGCWNLASSKWVAGDFNGDSKDDLVAMYDYGNADTGLVMFNGDASAPLASGHSVWRSGPNNFAWSHAKLAAGDFNGDAKSDLAAVYDYGSADTALFLFSGDATTPLHTYTQTWRSGPNNFAWSSAKLAAGYVNGDLNDDLVVMYNYGNATSAIIPFPGDASAPLHTDYLAWESGVGGYDWNNT
ncbi:MAG TPA: VCBS repeat-containing protein [Ktedonobacterales bacterium]